MYNRSLHSFVLFVSDHGSRQSPFSVRRDCHWFNPGSSWCGGVQESKLSTVAEIRCSDDGDVAAKDIVRPGSLFISRLFLFVDNDLLLSNTWDGVQSLPAAVVWELWISQLVTTSLQLPYSWNHKPQPVFWRWFQRVGVVARDPTNCVSGVCTSLHWRAAASLTWLHFQSVNPSYCNCIDGFDGSCEQVNNEHTHKTW